MTAEEMKRELREKMEKLKPPSFKVKTLEMVNFLDHNVSFEFWYDEKNQNLIARVGKPEKFKFPLRKGAYRRETVVTAYRV